MTVRGSPTVAMCNRNNTGFTLIELSIVLVIIGLIVGGVLLGRDLIAGAEIRAQISQIEKYNTSVNAFRAKYGFIPGDVPAARAAQLGFFAISGASAGTIGFQDGNGLLETGAGAYSGYGEVLAFWRHLTDAQMIDGNFGTAASGSELQTAGGFPGNVPVNVNEARIAEVVPRAEIGRGNYLHVGGGYMSGLGGQNSTSNYMHIVALVTIASNGTVVVTSRLTPIESQNIDVKIDDGLPLAGKAQLVFAFVLPAGAPCVVVATSTYDVGTANGDQAVCAMRLTMQ